MDKEKKENSRKEHRTSIGGQAVMEGVMMRGPHNVATAVRKPDGEIVIDDMKLGKIRTGRFVKLPIVRGCVNFIDSMIIGVKSLMFSSMWMTRASLLNKNRQNLRCGLTKSSGRKKQ